jgi:hypothetical protein
MYTLRVAPTKLIAAVRFAFDAYTVLWNDQNMQLTLLVVEASGESTVGYDSHALLTWDINTRAALWLMVAFGSPVNSPPNLCEVYNGRRECGDASWADGLPGAFGRPGSQVATLHKWQPDTIYAMYVDMAERRCDGYGLHSSFTLPGGRDDVIDCVGNCSTGEGYCYSSSDGSLCANCRLFPTGDGDDVLCYQYGRPQGGPVRGSELWASKGCNDAAWEAHGVAARAETYRRCSGRLGQTRAKLWLIEAGVLVHSYPILQDNDNIGYAHDAEKLGCLAVLRSGQKLAMPESGTPLDLDAYVIDRQDPQKSCCDTLFERTGQSCDLFRALL